MTVDWAWASSYLQGGRKKWERPLYDRGLRIWKVNKWDPDSDIAVGWNFYNPVPIVIYHKNNTTTIQCPTQTNGGYTWNSLRSFSTRFTIRRYAGLKNLYQRNFKFYIEEADAKYIEGKEQGCRTCKQSGFVDSWCNPTHCWNVKTDDDGNKKCDDHPDMEINSRAWFSHAHLLPCEHGSMDGHTVFKGQQCYSCNGAKRRIYGSRYERTLWDGSPLRLMDGKIIKSAATLLERMIADYVEPTS